MSKKRNTNKTLTKSNNVFTQVVFQVYVSLKENYSVRVENTEFNILNTTLNSIV